MTGPEHYLTAERLVSAARSPKGRTEEDSATLLAAQVHATLALADFFRAWTEAQS